MHKPGDPEQSALRQILVYALARTKAALDEQDVYLPGFVWRLIGKTTRL
jgi:hypothetical protein